MCHGTTLSFWWLSCTNSRHFQNPLWSSHKCPNHLPWKNFKKWIMWRSSAGLAPCLQRLIWTFTSSQSPPSFSGFSMASSSSWPSTQLDDQPSSSMFCLSFSRQHQDMREEEQLIKQAKSELLVSSQFIWSKHCNISSKIMFLIILDWPLHGTQFSIGQICKINWSAALTEFSVPR